MEEILYTILICCLISFWAIGYAYLKAQQEITAHENNLKAFKKKSEHKIKNLKELKKQLDEKLAQLQNELKELQAENNSETS